MRQALYASVACVAFLALGLLGALPAREQPALVASALPLRRVLADAGQFPSPHNLSLPVPISDCLPLSRSVIVSSEPKQEF